MISRLDIDRHSSAAAIAAVDDLRTLTGPALAEARLGVLRDLISIPKGIDDDLRAEPIYRIASSMWMSGEQLLNAAEAAALSVALCSDPNGDTACRRLLFQGTVLNSISNHTDGWHCFERAYHIARRLDSPTLQAMALNNLGLTFHHLGAYERASDMYELAIDRALADPLDRPDLAAVCPGSVLSNFALTCMHTLRYAEGITMIEDALEKLPDPVDARTSMMRSLTLATYTQLLIGTGRLTDAQRAADEALRLAQSSGAMRALLEANAAVASCLTHSSDPTQMDLGATIVTTALEKSRAIPESHRNVLIVASLMCERAGDAAGARRHLRDFALSMRRSVNQSLVAEQSVSFATADHTDESMAQMLGARERNFVTLLRQQLGSEARLISISIKAETAVDPDGLHPFRVARLTGLLALHLGYSPSEADDLARSALLHDIGVVGVPRQILISEGFLDDEDMRYVRDHPIEGASMVLASGVPYASLAAGVIRSHHERHDGNGYPDRLAGEAIPAGAQMCSLADAFDVMVHGRPYMPARSIDEAKATILANAGTQFHPQMASAFATMLDTLPRDLVALDGFLSESASDLPFTRARAIFEHARQALVRL